MSFNKVNSGAPWSPPSAAVWNDLLDMLAWSKAQRNGASFSNSSSPLDRDTVYVKNNSGADRNRFDILGLNGVAFVPTDNLPEFYKEPAIIGELPTAASHTGKIAILAEPIKSGKIGRAVISGRSYCLVNMTDAAHQYADVSDGSATTLISGGSGPAQILYVESGTGSKRAVVRLANAPPPPIPAMFYTGSTFATVTGTSAASPTVLLGSPALLGAPGIITSYNSATGEFTYDSRPGPLEFHLTTYTGLSGATLTAGQAISVEAYVQVNGTIPPAAGNWAINGFQSVVHFNEHYQPAQLFAQSFSVDAWPAANGRVFRICAHKTTAGGPTAAVSVLGMLSVKRVRLS